jgi:hypothetical protein
MVKTVGNLSAVHPCVILTTDCLDQQAWVGGADFVEIIKC